MTSSATDDMLKVQNRIDESSRDGEKVDISSIREPNELPKQFSLFSTLAFGFSMTNSWLGYSATFITPLLLGGGPTVFFGLVTASIASCFISTFSVLEE